MTDQETKIFSKSITSMEQLSLIRPLFLFRGKEVVASKFKSTFMQITRGFLCEKWKPIFLPRLMFNLRTFSRQDTARW